MALTNTMFGGLLGTTRTNDSTSAEENHDGQETPAAAPPPTAMATITQDDALAFTLPDTTKHREPATNNATGPAGQPGRRDTFAPGQEHQQHQAIHQILIAMQATLTATQRNNEFAWQRGAEQNAAAFKEEALAPSSRLRIFV